MGARSTTFALLTREGDGKWAEHAIKMYDAEDTARAVSREGVDRSPQMVSWCLWDPLELEDLLDDVERNSGAVGHLMREIGATDAEEIIPRLIERGWFVPLGEGSR